MARVFPTGIQDCEGHMLYLGDIVVRLIDSKRFYISYVADMGECLEDTETETFAKLTPTEAMNFKLKESVFEYKP